MPKIGAAIKRHGGKSYLAKRIVSMMPPRARNPNNPDPKDEGWVHYVETHFGGGAVLFENDPEGISEVINDIEGELTNFWQVLQCEDGFPQFLRLVQAIPFSKREYENACSNNGHWSESCVDRAVAFFIRNRQSRQALEKDFATLSRNRTRQGMNEQVSAWLSAVEGLPEVHARLRRVVILDYGMDAVDVIEQQDGKRTLFYVDPPYVHETRTALDAFHHEMDERDHIRLLEALQVIEGRFLLSGYHSQLYDEFALDAGWSCAEFEIDNKAGGGDVKRRMTECVWTNY